MDNIIRYSIDDSPVIVVIPNMESGERYKYMIKDICCSTILDNACSMFSTCSTDAVTVSQYSLRNTGSERGSNSIA
jgi:hypothetical protein